MTDSQALQILLANDFKVESDGSLKPSEKTSRIFLAIEVLLANGYTFVDGKIHPPWLTISELLMKYRGPMPSLSTIKRETGKGFKAKKGDSRYWLIHQLTFNEWLEEWRQSNHRKEENERTTEALSLGGQYNFEDEEMFPDPEGVSLIIIDEELRSNEFVQEFLDYHGHDLPTVIYQNSGEFTNLALGIDIKTKKHTILWIGDEDKKPYPRWQGWEPPPNAPKEPNDATGIPCEECAGTGICQVCFGDGCDFCIFKGRPGKCTDCQGEG